MSDEKLREYETFLTRILFTIGLCFSYPINHFFLVINVRCLKGKEMQNYGVLRVDLIGNLLTVRICSNIVSTMISEDFTMK